MSVKIGPGQDSKSVSAFRPINVIKVESSDTICFSPCQPRTVHRKTLAGASTFSVPADVAEMKKAGSHAGWFSDTATREEVDEIRVHSAPHKLLLDSGCYKLELPNYLKDGIDVQSVFEGLREIVQFSYMLFLGEENDDFAASEEVR